MKSKLLPSTKLNSLIDESTQLMNIIGKSIVTTKANSNANGQRSR